MTTTAYPCDYSHQLHTIPTDDKHEVTVRQIIDAIDAWVQFNFRTEYGLEINGSEIYWITYEDGQDRVKAHAGPLLRVGIRHGGNEGWILNAYVNGKSTPILWAKLWTLDAACQLQAALTRASVDCLA